MLVGESLSESFSGASAHLIPLSDLQNYVEFVQPLKIATANNDKIYACRSGTMCVVRSASSVKIGGSGGTQSLQGSSRD